MNGPRLILAWAAVVALAILVLAGYTAGIVAELRSCG